MEGSRLQSREYFIPPSPNPMASYPKNNFPIRSEDIEFGKVEAKKKVYFKVGA